MGRYVGIRRDAEGLAEAAEVTAFWDRFVSQRSFRTPKGWELQNLLTVAQLTIRAATLREESRGVHYRSDFPDTLPESPGHTVIAAEDLCDDRVEQPEGEAALAVNG